MNKTGLELLPADNEKVQQRRLNALLAFIPLPLP